MKLKVALKVSHVYTRLEQQLEAESRIKGKPRLYNEETQQADEGSIKGKPCLYKEEG